MPFLLAGIFALSVVVLIALLAQRAGRKAIQEREAFAMREAAQREDRAAKQKQWSENLQKELRDVCHR